MTTEGLSPALRALEAAILTFYQEERLHSPQLIYAGAFFIFIGYWVIGSEARVESYFSRKKTTKLPKTRWWRVQGWLYDNLRPAAYPLIAVGFVEMVIGAVTYLQAGLKLRVLIESLPNASSTVLLIEQERISFHLEFLFYLLRIEIGASIICSVIILFLLFSSSGVKALAAGILPQALFLFWYGSKGFERLTLYFNALHL